MSAVLNPAPSGSTARLPDVTGICVVAGKVLAVRPFVTADRRRIQFVMVAMPAADEFSHPNTVEVNAGDTSTMVGDTVRWRCKVQGFPKLRKPWTNPDTGEARPGFKTADIALVLVSAS